MIEHRVNQILAAKEDWLFQSKIELNHQIEQTVQQGFEKSDVFHALNWVKEEVNETSLTNWLNQIPKKNSEPKKVLFFHAGNLPLVGIQDVLACLLSGHHYYGKLSKKDPFLVQGFLEAVKKFIKDVTIDFDTNYHSFQNLEADYFVFSGSETSIKEVSELLTASKSIHHSTKQLIRTAHFSVAHLVSDKEEELYDVIEAALRYSGEGCRSVKVIVAPFGLYDAGCDVSDVLESWWIKTKRSPELLPESALFYMAYWKSIGTPLMKWESKVVVETYPERFYPGIIYWIKGGEVEIATLKQQFGNQIQTIYGTQNESILKAQWPDLNWKPDQVDVLEFLSK